MARDFLSLDMRVPRKIKKERKKKDREDINYWLGVRSSKTKWDIGADSDRYRVKKLINWYNYIYTQKES